MLSGVLPVIHMPYKDDFEIDYDVLETEIDYIYSCGAQGIVFALVSEVLRLSEQERFAAAEFLAAKNSGRGSVTISVGAESTYCAVRYAKQAEQAGADALMAVPPLSTAAGEGELRRYYAAVLGAVKLPVVVQDASAYVGKGMSTAFQVELWKEYGDRILFKPEASPVGPVITAMNEMTGGKARIFEGSGGAQLVENYRRGVSGTMPGVGLLPGIVALWNALKAGDDAKIYAISPIIGAILSLASGLDGYLAIEKYLMVRAGIFKNRLVRGPVGFTLDVPAERELDRLAGRLKSAVAGS